VVRGDRRWLLRGLSLGKIEEELRTKRKGGGPRDNSYATMTDGGP